METDSTPAEASCSKPRRPWLAALLSLLVWPLGQVYAGRLRRSLLLWFAGVCFFFALTFGAVSLPLGVVGCWLLCLSILAFRLYLAVDAYVVARQNRYAPMRRYQRWWVYVLFLILFYSSQETLVYLNRSFIGEAFVIPTRSMAPTILAGERILVDKLSYRLDHIQRNDLVVFFSEGPGSPLYVQRVIGLPGEEIEVKNERVFINGAVWDDPHAVFDKREPPWEPLANSARVKLPPHHYYLLGDNRRMCKDSRILGPIPLWDMYGIARFIYWSRERTFPDPNDTTHCVLGPFHWDRIGMRLDQR